MMITTSACASGVAALGATTILRFGVFELDPHAEQLRRNGLTVRLQPQPFKLLRLLVREAGRLVTRDQIREFCRTRLAPYKVPRIIKLIDAIPLDDRGKVRRSALAEL